jgi:uncharacterized protein
VTRYLILFILFAVLYRLLRSMIRGFFAPSGRRTKPREESLPSEELVQDPFCLTYVPIRSALRKKVDGTELFFCSPECAKRYIARKRS